MNPSLSDTLSKIPLFSALESAQLDHIARHTHRHHVAKQSILFQKGDPAEGFYFLLSGQIKLALISADGNEKVVEFINPGMSFGEAVMLIGQPYPAYAQTLADSEYLYISRDVVLDSIDESSDFSRRLLAGLCHRLHRMVRDVEDLSLHSATQRVIGYLLREELLGDTGANSASITLPAQKALVASRLNLTPETFSRVLNQLQSAAVIAVSGRTIQILDVAKLRGFQAG